MKTAKKHYERWSAADDYRLKTLVRQGATTPEAAEALGRTRSSVASRKYNLGISERIAPARSAQTKAPKPTHTLESTYPDLAAAVKALSALGIRTLTLEFQEN